MFSSMEVTSWLLGLLRNGSWVLTLGMEEDTQIPRQAGRRKKETNGVGAGTLEGLIIVRKTLYSSWSHCSFVPSQLH